jgi:hypothetical protein
VNIAMASQLASGVIIPCSDISTPLATEKESAPILPEHIRVEYQRTICARLGPLFLPIRVSQNEAPFLGGEGWEVVQWPTVDFIEKKEIMVIVYALVMGFNTPEEVERGKHKATR